MFNIYANLTQEFNKGKLRAIISSGQAVVLHRLAIMSKDGDWIIREQNESLTHILNVLAKHNARYRFGAPLDIRWMAGGWSSHFEFYNDSLRVRTDFFTRPPRMSSSDLKRLWLEHKDHELPFLNAKDLAEIKKTNREKDYVVIGELARLIHDPADQILYSRSARDILKLAATFPDLITRLVNKRPILSAISKGRDELGVKLDAERRSLMRINEERLKVYSLASEKWATIWPALSKEIENVSVLKAHEIVIKRALGVLPFNISL